MGERDRRDYGKGRGIRATVLLPQADPLGAWQGPGENGILPVFPSSPTTGQILGEAGVIMEAMTWQSPSLQFPGPQ